MKLEYIKPNILRDENHVYTNKITGQLYTGVTTILQVRSAPFLMFWTTKCNYEWMCDNWDITKQYSQEEKEKLLLEAKNAHAKVVKKATNIGSKVHYWIEEYIKEKMKGHNISQPLPEEKEVTTAINAFLQWEKENEVEWLESELLVASEKNLYAGTLDAIGMVNGKLTLIDFKTSSMISEDYYLQTAGYQIALEEMGIVPEQRMILRFEKLTEVDWLKKNEKNLKRYPEMKYKVFEAKIVPSDLRFDKETFLHCREIHRWNLYIENQIKK